MNQTLINILNDIGPEEEIKFSSEGPSRLWFIVDKSYPGGSSSVGMILDDKERPPGMDQDEYFAHELALALKSVREHAIKHKTD